MVTRSGRDSELNPDAEPFVPQVTTGLDETGNDMSSLMWRPGKGTSRGKPKNYPSEIPQPAEESRGGVLPEADSAPESGPSEMRPEDWSRD